MDPHTAVAFHVARQRRTPGRPCVVLSTASPYKFPAVVLAALGQRPPADEFAALEELQRRTGTKAPAPLAALRHKAPRFTRVIGKDEIEAAALSL